MCVWCLEDSVWKYLLLFNYSAFSFSDGKPDSQAGRVDAQERNALASLLSFNPADASSTDDDDDDNGT